MGIQKTFKALSDNTRREILELLKDGAVSAGDIAARFDMTAATISHHLAVLKDAELVSDEKRGKFIYYELNTSVIDDIIRWMTAFQGGNNDAK
ncbi:MAG: autorepressor SdpR family transcription factor [Oscillospiraceae bacterium]|nr:autorepressor SdpR family transcription factor [Oscillospiraceae bacterium]